MKAINGTTIIGIDHGYGNTKTAGHCFPTGILAYDSEPLFTRDMLEYDENTMTLYVTGGGGCLVRNFGKFSKTRTVFVEDICAAAKGYEFLAEAQLRAGK